MLTDIRCPVCGRLICRASGVALLAIRCPKCKTDTDVTLAGVTAAHVPQIAPNGATGYIPPKQ